MPSFGSVGDNLSPGIQPVTVALVDNGLDSAMMESFWSSMQIELLNRRRWKTRIELANAVFDYIGSSTIASGDTPPSATSPQPNTNSSTTPSPPEDSSPSAETNA